MSHKGAEPGSLNLERSSWREVAARVYSQGCSRQRSGNSKGHGAGESQQGGKYG